MSRVRRVARPAQGRDARAVLAAVLGSVDCGVVWFGAAGEIRGVNEWFRKVLRIDPRELSTIRDFHILVARLAPHLTDPEAAAARWRERFERDEDCRDELELANPEQRVLERFARPVSDMNGRRVGWIEIYRDVTSQRLIEAKMFHTERVATLGQMVSGIAHELSNPLTSILGYAQILAGSHAAPEREGDLQCILQEAERAGRITKNLLLFARESNLERTRVDLNDVVTRTVELRSYPLRLENIVVAADLDPELPATVADAGQLQQVLLNLLLNAEQAIRQAGGPGHIWVQTRRVAADRVAFQVADDGPGVVPEAAPRIFDPFFTTKPPGVGTGLGLSIASGIVQEHGGKITFEKRPGGGAVFTVELLAAEPQGAATAPKPQLRVAPADGLSGGPPTLAERRSEGILVVEDEPTVARLIADVLGAEGYPVDTALDSRDGLERIGRKAYGLVICDLRMPHLDGRGFYRELVRRGSPLAHRFIFVTGDTLAPHTVQFLETSGVPYLAKPFLVEELKEAVQVAMAAAKEREKNAVAQVSQRSVRPTRPAANRQD